MKKTVFILTLLFLSFPLWAEITVEKVQGNVEIMLPGTDSWKAAEEGSELPGDCRISTGFNSTALLLVNGKTTVSLKALSRLTVEEATKQSSGTQNTRLFLGSGRIRADVRKSEGSIHDFKVRTPVATAAVRGTSFDMASGRLDVTEGTVSFTVGSYSFSVLRGQSSRITLINGRPGLLSPTQSALADRQVQSSTSANRFNTETGGTGSTGRSGYAAIELR